jgi:hypothetical protein
VGVLRLAEVLISGIVFNPGTFRVPVPPELNIRLHCHAQWRPQHSEIARCTQ